MSSMTVVDRTGHASPVDAEWGPDMGWCVEADGESILAGYATRAEAEAAITSGLAAQCDPMAVTA
jgi:hypothetical protein